MQNYAFSSKPPRKKQKFCKTSAKSPEICEIPNRTGQDLRHLRHLRAPIPNDRIDQKNCGNLLEYQEIRKKAVISFSFYY